MKNPEQYFLSDDGIFPNSPLPVLHYRKAIDLPLLLPAMEVEGRFKEHGWTNNWRNGIYTYHHYHSVTHEVLGVVKGKAVLLLGGDNGITIPVEEGDVIVLPAGVAHKNLGEENDIICIGGYPQGKDFDMNYGKPEERPQADRNIAGLPIPEEDPLYGTEGPLVGIWRSFKPK